MTPSRRNVLLGLVAGGAALGASRLCWLAPTEPLHYRHVPVLGTRVSFAVRHPDRRVAEQAMADGVRALFRVQHAMTLHGPSPLTDLNASALDRAVTVPESVWEVLTASRDLHRRTGGLFDPLVGRLVTRLEARASRDEAPPGRAELAMWREGARWSHLHEDPEQRAVTFSHPEVSLDFNGIAKGYAVDRAADALRARGVEHFLVNAGGDLYAAGRPDDRAEGWTVRIDTGRPDVPVRRSFVVSDGAVATSGNGFRPRSRAGKRVAHLVLPEAATLTDRWVTATALAPTALEADAWSTAGFVGAPGPLRERLAQEESTRLHCVTPDGSVVEVWA